MSNPFRFLFIFCAILLFGAGCARDAAVSKQAMPAQPSVPSAAPSAQIAPTAVLTPQVEFVCPLTEGAVKRYCKLGGSLDITQCVVFDTAKFSGVVQAHIRPIAAFGVTSNNLTAVVEAQRLSENRYVAEEAPREYLSNPCDSWATKSVSGLGDEAILTPLTFGGCEASRRSTLADLEVAARLYIRKGDKVAYVAHTTRLDPGRQPCSIDELISLAKEVIVPAMSQ